MTIAFNLNDYWQIHVVIAHYLLLTFYLCTCFDTLLKKERFCFMYNRSSLIKSFFIK